MYPFLLCVFDALMTFVQFPAAVVLGRISYVSTHFVIENVISYAKELTCYTLFVIEVSVCSMFRYAHVLFLVMPFPDTSSC